MALSRVTVWNAGDTLTAAAQNGEFNNILNNALSLISPLTGNLNANLRQITNLLLETQTASQTAANAGRTYYQTTTNQVEVDDGTNIRRIPTIASVARGDMIVAGSTANQWTRLARSGAGSFPISDGTDTVASTILLPNSALTNGQLIVGSTGVAAVAAVPTGNGITVTTGAGTLTLAPNPTRSTADVTTSETTTSTSYTDLATSGPAVTITPGRATDQRLDYSARCSNTTADTQNLVSPAIAGATASDVDALAITPYNTGGGSGNFYRATAHAMPLAVANASTHTLKYRVVSGTGTFVNRRISAFTLN